MRPPRPTSNAWRREIAAEDPVNHPAYTARVFDLRETVIKDIRPTLLLLLAAAALLFLITCANAAGLLLARSVARARETAMRVALGASRSQLAAHYLAESLPIALVGAAAGIVLSLTLTPGVVSMVADYLPRAEEIAVDWAVVLFAAGAAILASVLSSLAPLWQALRTAPAEALGEGARGVSRRAQPSPVSVARRRRNRARLRPARGQRYPDQPPQESVAHIRRSRTPIRC